MEDKQLLEAVGRTIDEKLEPIHTRLDKMEADIAEIKEDTTITREAVNTLVAWADQVGPVVRVGFPPKD